MSYNVTSLIDAEAVQLALQAVTDIGSNPIEPAPEIAFLRSAQNTNGILESTVVDGGGTKNKTVKLVYMPRMREDEISTTLTTGCTAGNSEGQKSTTYTIDPSTGVEGKRTFVIADLVHNQTNTQEFIGKVVAMLIDGTLRKAQSQIAGQMAALYGNFAVDNGETGLTGTTLKTVATKYPSSGTPGPVWNPEALQEINFSARNSGFKGKPYVFGFGAIYRYWEYLFNLGNYSSQGVDFQSWANTGMSQFVESMKMHTALNGPSGSGSKFLAVDAGALHLLQFNKYAEPALQMHDNALVQTVIVEPKTGLPFNYKAVVNCGETIDVTVSTAFKVVALPTDMYQTADRLTGTNGVLQFQVTNT